MAHTQSKKNSRLPYAAAQQADYAGKPVSSLTCVGGFMARILKLDFYSQNSSALCPYDGDIGLKNLETGRLKVEVGENLRHHRTANLRESVKNQYFKEKSHCCPVDFLAPRCKAASGLGLQ